MFEDQVMSTDAACGSDSRRDPLTRALVTCMSLSTGLSAAEFSVAIASGSSAHSRLLPVVDSRFPGLSRLSKQAFAPSATKSIEEAMQACSPIAWNMKNLPLGIARTATTESGILAPAIAFPLGSPAERRGLAFFSGPHLRLSVDQVCDVHARLFGLFPALCEARPWQRTDAQPISPRERECLVMTAAGLTSEDIAAALGLSIHTANQYIQATIQKLNAVNRMHAVAKALRLGLIA